MGSLGEMVRWIWGDRKTEQTGALEFTEHRVFNWVLVHYTSHWIGCPYIAWTNLQVR